MKIDRQGLDKIAHLARLEVDEKDADQMVNDMSEMVAFVEKLNEVDTEGVEPLTSMSHEVNALREDEVQPHLDKQAALKNAPATNDDYFRVPKVLE